MAKSKTITLTEKKWMDVYLAIHQQILNTRLTFLKNPGNINDYDAEMQDLEQRICRNVKSVLEYDTEAAKKVDDLIASAKSHMRNAKAV